MTLFGNRAADWKTVIECSFGVEGYKIEVGKVADHKGNLPGLN